MEEGESCVEKLSNMEFVREWASGGVCQQLEVPL